MQNAWGLLIDRGVEDEEAPVKISSDAEHLTYQVAVGDFGGRAIWQAEAKAAQSSTV